MSKHFVGERGLVVPRTAPSHFVMFDNESPILSAEMYSCFDQLTIERQGVLHGEYILFPDALCLVSKNGQLLKINSAAEDIDGSRQIDAIIRSSHYGDLILHVIRHWDQYPVLEQCPIISDKYEANYYHFSLELIPRIRFLQLYPRKPVLVTPSSLSKSFQVDLWQRGLHDRDIIPIKAPVRVRDPILFTDTMSENSLDWIQRNIDLKADGGSRRIYIRRSGQGTRSAGGGGFREDDNLLALLRRFDFETVEFGNGEKSLAEQISQLEGAGLILAPHGAGLSNLAYLRGPTSVIEVMGIQTLRSCFMHLCAFKKFRYYGFVAPYDPEGNLVIDPVKVEKAIEMLRG